MNASTSSAALLCALSLAAAALLVAPSAAFATERFPGEVAAALPGISIPDCGLCHAGGTTGRGTASTPFGLAMRARGLTVGDSGSVARAIEKMVADGVDSDGDGTTDIDELTMGSNPNLPAGANAPPSIQYGCAQVAPGNAASSVHGAPFVAGLAIVGIALRRARARRSRSGTI